MEETTTEYRLQFSIRAKLLAIQKRRLYSNSLLFQVVLFIPEIFKDMFNSCTYLRVLQLWLILKINNPKQLVHINCEIHFTSEIEFTSGHLGQ